MQLQPVQRHISALSASQLVQTIKAFGKAWVLRPEIGSPEWRMEEVAIDDAERNVFEPPMVGHPLRETYIRKHGRWLRMQ